MKTMLKKYEKTWILFLTSKYPCQPFFYFWQLFLFFWQIYLSKRKRSVTM